MYRYVFDLFREQQEARNRALEYIYAQISGTHKASDISLIQQNNGTTISVFYKGRHIGTIREYYNGSTWNIEAKRIPFDEPDGEESDDHLVTCICDEMDGFRNIIYAIGPGYSYEDLTDAEKKIINLQKEDL